MIKYYDVEILYYSGEENYIVDTLGRKTTHMSILVTTQTVANWSWASWNRDIN